MRGSHLWRPFFAFFLSFFASVLLYILIAQLPFRIDLSRQKVLSLTEQSIQLMRTLDTDVKITAFIGKNSEDLLVLNLLREYARYASRFDLEVVDPDRNPERANLMGVDTYGTLVCESRYGRRDIYLYQLFSQSEKGDASPIFVGEQIITGVLKALVSYEAPTVDVMLFGVEHQIRDSGLDTVFLAIERDFRRVRVISDLPEKPALLTIVVAPTFPLPKKTVNYLKEQILSGRHIMLLLDPLRSAEGISEWLSLYGITIIDGVVIDPDAAYFHAVSTIIPSFGTHAITAPMQRHALSMVLPVAGALDLTNVTANIEVTPLLLSSSKAIVQKDTLPIKAGEFVLAALFSFPSKSKLLLVRDADFLRNEFIAVHGNQEFILNAVSVLLNHYEEVTIRPRLMSGSPIVLTSTQTGWFFLLIAIPPLAFLFVYMCVWWRRRQYRR